MFAKKWFLTLLCSCFALLGWGQERPHVTAHLSQDSIQIGDQVDLTIEVTKDMTQVVEFPTFDKELNEKMVEFLSESGVDTLAKEGRALTLSKRYRMTVFDAGHYNLGLFPLLLLDKNIVDTIWTKDSLRLIVNTFDIDTTTQQIFDIKPVMQTPLRFGEVSIYLLWGLLGIAVLAALIWWIMRLVKRRRMFGPIGKIDPPHVSAIKALEKLHTQKLWQIGKVKHYYTSMTDIMRTYLEERYGINAPEMTSEEIIAALKANDLPATPYRNLTDLLRTADYVKFAKYLPDPEQNETYYINAYYFVEQTKASETEPGVVELTDELLVEREKEVRDE